MSDFGRIVERARVVYKVILACTFSLVRFVTQIRFSLAEPARYNGEKLNSGNENH